MYHDVKNIIGIYWAHCGDNPRVMVLTRADWNNDVRSARCLLGRGQNRKQTGWIIHRVAGHMSCSGLLNDLKLFTSSASPSLPSASLPRADAPRSPEMLKLVTDCSIRHGHPLIPPQWVFFLHFSLSHRYLKLHHITVSVSLSLLLLPLCVVYIRAVLCVCVTWRITQCPRRGLVSPRSWRKCRSLPVCAAHLSDGRLCVRKEKGKGEFRAGVVASPSGQELQQAAFGGSTRKRQRGGWDPLTLSGTFNKVFLQVRAWAVIALLVYV